MSTNRRKGDFPYYLDVSNARVDKCRTAYFPVNEVQMKNVVRGGNRVVSRPRFGIGTLAIALALLIGGVYGLILLVVS